MCGEKNSPLIWYKKVLKNFSTSLRNLNPHLLFLLLGFFCAKLQVYFKFIKQ